MILIKWLNLSRWVKNYSVSSIYFVFICEGETALKKFLWVTYTFHCRFVIFQIFFLVLRSSIVQLLSTRRFSLTMWETGFRISNWWHSPGMCWKFDLCCVKFLNFLILLHQLSISDLRSKRSNLVAGKKGWRWRFCWINTFNGFRGET